MRKRRRRGKRLGRDADQPHPTLLLLQAELQTTSQRVTLSDSSTAPVPVAPGESLDSIISHEVKELGKHTCVVMCPATPALTPAAYCMLHNAHRLICTVTYTTPDGDKLFFRKSFKFMISNPLAVKTKVYNVEACAKAYPFVALAARSAPSTRVSLHTL
jgi:hypothetical protein